MMFFFLPAFCSDEQNSQSFNGKRLRGPGSAKPNGAKNVDFSEGKYSDLPRTVPGIFAFLKQRFLKKQKKLLEKIKFLVSSSRM